MGTQFVSPAIFAPFLVLSLALGACGGSGKNGGPGAGGDASLSARLGADLRSNLEDDGRLSGAQIDSTVDSAVAAGEKAGGDLTSAGPAFTSGAASGLKGALALKLGATLAARATLSQDDLIGINGIAVRTCVEAWDAFGTGQGNIAGYLRQMSRTAMAELATLEIDPALLEEALGAYGAMLVDAFEAAGFDPDSYADAVAAASAGALEGLGDLSDSAAYDGVDFDAGFIESWTEGMAGELAALDFDAEFSGFDFADFFDAIIDGVMDGVADDPGLGFDQADLESGFGDALDAVEAATGEELYDETTIDDAIDEALTGQPPIFSYGDFGDYLEFAAGETVSALLPAVLGDPVDSWSIAPDPSDIGLSFNLVDGSFDGTIAASAGSYDFVVTATNANGGADLALTIVVASPVAATPPIFIYALSGLYTGDLATNGAAAACVSELASQGFVAAHADYTFSAEILVGGLDAIDIIDRVPIGEHAREVGTEAANWDSSWTDLWDSGPPLSTFAADFGWVGGTDFWWSGANPDGTTATDFCDNGGGAWTDASNPINGILGDADNSGSTTWANYGTSACDSSAHVLCVAY